MEDFRSRAERVIRQTFGGDHHVASLKWFDDSCTFLVNEQMATYDYADMTKLVVHCHDNCVRGEVSGGGPKRLKVILSDRARTHKHPDIGAHPTLEQHVEQIRNGGSYQPLFDKLRGGV
jgi:hypothetical protein